jgi:hypothetical protein
MKRRKKVRWATTPDRAVDRTRVGRGVGGRARRAPVDLIVDLDFSSETR